MKLYQITFFFSAATVCLAIAIYVDQEGFDHYENAQNAAFTECKIETAPGALCELAFLCACSRSKGAVPVGLEAELQASWKSSV